MPAQKSLAIFSANCVSMTGVTYLSIPVLTAIVRTKMRSIKIRCAVCGLMNDPNWLTCQRCNTVIQELIDGHRMTLNGAQLWGVDSEHPELLPPNTFFPDPDDRRSDHQADHSPRLDDDQQDSDKSKVGK